MQRGGARGASSVQRMRRRPFVASTLADYTARYWCVKFTEMRHAHENREMQRYVGWYAIRCKVVYLDYLPFSADALRREIAHRMGAPRAVLPALFVNGMLVGDLAVMRTLEDSGRLRDVLQFGFMWSSRPDAPPDAHPKALPVPPSLFGDEALFRGQYRGAPMAAPVIALPKYVPRSGITHGDAAN
jgi:hypothetical protein